MNRVCSTFSKSVFLPRLFCHRFFASGGPTDARRNVMVVIVDFNGEHQLQINGKYSELLGRSPDFPFPGNVKSVNEESHLEKMVAHLIISDLEASAEKRRNKNKNAPGGTASAAALPLHKIVEPSFVVADDRRTTTTTATTKKRIRVLSSHRMRREVETEQTPMEKTTTTMSDDTKCEWTVGDWTVVGVDGIRMLWEEVNAMFGKQFTAGAEITVISLRANVTASSSSSPPPAAQQQQIATTELSPSFSSPAAAAAEGEEEKENNKATTLAEHADGETTARLVRSELIFTGFEFVRVANTLCSALKAAGFWADFVDPLNGRPYLRTKHRRPTEPSLGKQSLVLEWDPLNTFNGLNIINRRPSCSSGGGGVADTASTTTTAEASASAGEQHGDDGVGSSSTCKIIERADWSAMDFCGQLFTDCPPNSKEMQKILSTFVTATKEQQQQQNEDGDGQNGRGTLGEEEKEFI